MSAVIKSVYQDSIAEEIGLEAGDVIVKINDTEIKDVLDYRYLINDEFITLTIKTKQGTTEEVEIEKDAYEELGVEFETSLMDKAQHCKNKCIFCFIDQNPKGMRESIYFKDDDTRLSFFQGNYVTLTNVSDEKIDRLISLRISPINISVQATDPDLRVAMLKNPNAKNLMAQMKKFADNNIEMNCQIVLCPTINDGAHLQKSIFDLYALYPHVKSVSVVPVGLTKHREGLCKLTPVDESVAKDVLAHIHFWQNKFRKETGVNFVYASDEFYLKANEPIPAPESYDGYVQIENGVGLIASLHEELDDALLGDKLDVKAHSVSIVTGDAAFETIKDAVEKINKIYPQIKINVHKILNNFFGDSITVCGLLCGCDILEQLKGKELGDYLLLPQKTLRDGEKIFLDDVTTTYIENELGKKIITVKDDGYEFLDAILGI